MELKATAGFLHQLGCRRLAKACEFTDFRDIEKALTAEHDVGGGGCDTRFGSNNVVHVKILSVWPALPRRSWRTEGAGGLPVLFELVFCLEAALLSTRVELIRRAQKRKAGFGGLIYASARGESHAREAA